MRAKGVRGVAKRSDAAEEGTPPAVRVRVNPELNRGCMGELRIGDLVLEAHKDYEVSAEQYAELKGVEVAGKPAVLKA